VVIATHEGWSGTLGGARGLWVGFPDYVISKLKAGLGGVPVVAPSTLSQAGQCYAEKGFASDSLPQICPLYAVKTGRLISAAADQRHSDGETTRHAGNPTAVGAHLPWRMFTGSKFGCPGAVAMAFATWFR